MTTVNSWESLVVHTKISFFVALRVLDSPLCRIKMSKLNKQYISETGYYQTLSRNLFKDETVVRQRL